MEESQGDWKGEGYQGSSEGFGPNKIACSRYEEPAKEMEIDDEEKQDIGMDTELDTSIKLSAKKPRKARIIEEVMDQEMEANWVLSFL